MNEVIFSLNNGYVLHIQKSEQYDYEYTIFDEDMFLVDGGFWESNSTLEDAAEEIANDNSLYVASMIACDEDNCYEEVFLKLVF